MVRLWEQAWAELLPFLAIEAKIRAVVFSTNAIDSVNAVRARGHFPTRPPRSNASTSPS
ncbi:transposase [Micromonospora chersina]|uniref:transposase n=1 Tax=Micromonospora chersina TaxID=47854 RepID=UPI0037248DE1